MHESSLARQILREVLRTAEEAQSPKVKAVHGWVAETEALTPESLEFHFHAHAKGTIAEDATLHLRCTHVKARCQSCGHLYPPEHHVLLCPACDSTDAVLLGEIGLGIERIEVHE